MGPERHFDYSLGLQQGNGVAMRKTVVISACVVSVTLSIASLVILITSLTAYAATCTAQCHAGSVACTGAECSAEDFKGCKWTLGGHEYEKKCDVAEELEIQ